jgi:hypothetical protein
VNRIAASLLVVLLVQGCAHAPKSDRAAVEAEANAFAAATPAAAALVFEPSVVRDGLGPELSRDGRQPEAFVGFTEGVAEYFYLRWDDRQANWGNGHHGGDDWYERRAVSEKMGALYR